MLGVHPQRQEGLFWVGACVPVGRMTSADMDDLAHVADTWVYSPCSVCSILFMLHILPTFCIQDAALYNAALNHVGATAHAVYFPQLTPCTLDVRYRKMHSTLVSLVQVLVCTLYIKS